MRIAAGALAAVALVLGAAYIVLFHTYETPPVDPAWAVPPSAEIPPGAVTVRYTGCATLVFSDGETNVVIDGWFSRPGPLRMLFGEIAPDLDAIDRGLAANELTEAAAVFPIHSHYDHAMDAPEVARRTGAVLMGSPSTAMIGRGWGLPESQIRVVADRERIEIGAFTLVPIETQHYVFPDPALRERALGDPTITEPVVPPVGAFEYKVGQPYALLIEHPRGRVLIQGSAGFVEGGLEGVRADVLFLGIAGLGAQSADYRAAYWRETVDRSGAERIVPIHWDGLMSPIEGPFRGNPRIVSLAGIRDEGTLEFVQAMEDAHPALQVVTLPRYAPVVLF